MNGFILYNATSGNVSNTDAEGYEAYVSAEQIAEKEAVTDEACKEIISTCDDLFLANSRLRFMTKMWILYSLASILTIVLMATGRMKDWMVVGIVAGIVCGTLVLWIRHTMTVMAIMKQCVDRKDGKDERYKKLQEDVKMVMKRRAGAQTK